MIKAKPVVKDKFWILQHGERKVGEVNVITGDKDVGYSLMVGEHEIDVKDFSHMRDKFNIEVDETIDPTVHTEEPNDVHGFPAKGKIYEPMWDVQNQIPLYSQKEGSKSLYAAGWYKVYIKNKERIEFCPKLIILQRNPHEGPFKEEPTTNKFENFFE